MLKSKIHEARVTDASVRYEGSMTIDEELMEKVGLLPYEKILVSNMSNGSRFETYTIKGKRGGRQIELNGATAHLGKPGDPLTIMSFAQVEIGQVSTHKPKVIILDEKNEVRKQSL